jgi:two-component system OmpR family response regulator
MHTFTPSAHRQCTATKSVLVVEDDALLADGLTRILSRSGHVVDQVCTGVQADNSLRISTYQLVVLDVGLPDIDGFEVLRRLRSRRSEIPVLMLTARDRVDDRVRGLDLGADDYLAKPFSVTEFEARIRALSRRDDRMAISMAVRGLSVDVEAKRLKMNGVLVDLTAREWDLLQLFLGRVGRLLSKEQIIEQLPNAGRVLTTNAIEVYVSRLRSKVQASGVRIRTVRGFGYMWESENE